MGHIERDIFERMRDGDSIRFDDHQYPKIFEAVSRTIRLSAALNISTDIDQISDRLSEIIGAQIDRSTWVFIQFYANFG